MADNTNVLYQIGIHATAETALPTLPDKFSNMTLTGFTTFGGIDRGQDANLDEESVTVPFLREYSMVQGPLSQAASDHVLARAGATEWTFTAYDVDESVFTLDSNMSITTNTGTFTTTTTKRTVVIEINGLCSIYFPQCVVSVDQVESAVSGDDAAGTVQITVRPETTSSVVGGVRIDWFQPAA